ncbi:hypothetical protein DVH05_004180 [Phytophthora capsici]|nr:hypothetical protein DVH05_004180 [Phytophthora capsici]
MDRLSSCTDAAGVATELRTVLSDLADVQDHQEALNEVVTFLTAEEEERWTFVAQTLISDLSGESSIREVEVELLDELLTWMAQETVEKNPKVFELLLQFFQFSLTSLEDPGDGKRWTKWGEQVLAVVYQNTALIEKQKSLSGEEDTHAVLDGFNSYVVKIATLLMQLRNKLEGDEASTDLKTVTFVWKVGASTICN